MSRLVVQGNAGMCGFLPSPWTTTLVSITDTGLGAACTVPPGPKLGLLNIRGAVTAASWTSAAIGGWTTDTEPCSGTWDGVTCSSGQVTVLDLGGAQLDGSIPSSASYLTDLTTLVLLGNKLSGKLPGTGQVADG